MKLFRIALLCSLFALLACDNKVRVSIKVKTADAGAAAVKTSTNAVP